MANRGILPDAVDERAVVGYGRSRFPVFRTKILGTGLGEGGEAYLIGVADVAGIVDRRGISESDKIVENIPQKDENEEKLGDDPAVLPALMPDDFQ